MDSMDSINTTHWEWSSAMRIISGTAIAIVVMALLSGILLAVAWFSETPQSNKTTLSSGGATPCADGHVAYFPNASTALCVPASTFVVSADGTRASIAASGASVCAQTHVKGATTFGQESQTNQNEQNEQTATVTCHNKATNEFAIVATAHVGTPSTLQMYKINASTNGYAPSSL